MDAKQTAITAIIVCIFGIGLFVLLAGFVQIGAIPVL